jgi:hypothetical protein
MAARADDASIYPVEPRTPGRRDYEVTRRSAISGRSFFFGIVDLFDDACARLDIRSPRIGKGQMAGRPLKQLGLETRFELGEPADIAGRGRERRSWADSCPPTGA